MCSHRWPKGSRRDEATITCGNCNLVSPAKDWTRLPGTTTPGVQNQNTLSQMMKKQYVEPEGPTSGTQALDGEYPQPLSKLSTGTTITQMLVKGKDETALILKRGFEGGLVERPHMDSLLTASYNIVMTQLDKLLARVATGEVLDSTEARTLGEYVKMIRQLGSEEREQRRADKMNEMSDKDLYKVLGLTLPKKDEDE